MVGDIFPTSLPPPSLKCVSSSLKLYGIWLLLIGRRDLLRIFDSISQLVLRAYSSAFVHVENLLYLLYSISYYLDMNPAENTATVCTGQSKNIFCPALQLLKVKSAYYGKQAHRDCSGQYTADPTRLPRAMHGTPYKPLKKCVMANSLVTYMPNLTCMDKVIALRILRSIFKSHTSVMVILI